MVALVLCLLLAAAGPGFTQSATDAAAYARTAEEIHQAEQALLDLYFLPEADITADALQEIELLHGRVAAGYFRDLAERSGLLLFLTREELKRQEAARRGQETAARILQESRSDRFKSGGRKVSATLFWAALGSAATSFAGSFGCWYAAGDLDQRYLASTSTGEAARLKAWSAFFAGTSYTLAAAGTIGVAIAVPALAGLRPR